MREVRAWDKQDNEMKNVRTLDFDQLGDISLVILIEYYEDHIQGCNWFEFPERKPEDVKLMQCTGLKDSEGKEIYVDDIVSDGIHKGVVYFDEDRLQYRVKSGEGFTSEITFSQSGSQTNKTGYKVLGNIHENPELEV